MVIKLNFGRTGSVICNPKNIVAIDCPNQYGGIGNIVLTSSNPLEIWAGDGLLYSTHIELHFSYIKSIETRSNENESDEDWVIEWKSNSVFTYQQYNEGADILRHILNANPI